MTSVLSSRTRPDRERRQRIGYDVFADPTMNERYLRTPAIQSGTKRLILTTSGVQAVCREPPPVLRPPAARVLGGWGGDTLRPAQQRMFRTKHPGFP